MNSREIVLGTIEYTGTERVAGSMPAPYWNDLSHASYKLQGVSLTWQDVGGGRQEYVDEWGNTWARVDDYSKGEVARGAVENLDEVYTAPLPDLARSVPAKYLVPGGATNGMVTQHPSTFRWSKTAPSAAMTTSSNCLCQDRRGSSSFFFWSASLDHLAGQSGLSTRTGLRQTFHSGFFFRSLLTSVVVHGVSM